MVVAYAALTTKDAERPARSAPAPTGTGAAGKCLAARLLFASIRRSLRLHLGVRRHEIGAVVIGHVDHHALAVLKRGLADEGAQRRLMVNRAIRDRPERGLDLYPLRRVDQFLAVGRARLGEDRGGRFYDGIADDGAEPRIIVVFRLISLQERRVIGNRDGVPGVAGDDPSDRRLVLQRIEIFGLAGEEGSRPRDP